MYTLSLICTVVVMYVLYYNVFIYDMRWIIKSFVMRDYVNLYYTCVYYYTSIKAMYIIVYNQDFWQRCGLKCWTPF